MKKFKYVLCLICTFFICVTFAGCSLEDFGIETGGKSAYEIAVENGFDGTEGEWLASLQGKDGEYAGQGLSAYEIAVENGFVGTESEWLASLNNFEDIFMLSMNKCVTSIVAITTETSTGSGVILDYNKSTLMAHVITNFHVICDENSHMVSDNIKCYLYGREGGNASLALNCNYIGSAPGCDIAVLEVYIPSSLASQTVVTSAVVGSSSYLPVGMRVGAIGNSKGKGISVTSGVVSVPNEYSSLTRNDTGAQTKLRVIRYDSFIINGNSGGGLFNVNGELVGIVNARSADESVDFFYAIPINLAYNIYQNILQNCNMTKKTTDRICLGVETAIYGMASLMNEETQTIYSKHEVRVKAMPNASLMSEFNSLDILEEITIKRGTTTICQKVINRQCDITDAMWHAQDGDYITFKVKRGESNTNVTITAGDFYSNPTGDDSIF